MANSTSYKWLWMVGLAGALAFVGCDKQGEQAKTAPKAAKGTPTTGVAAATTTEAAAAKPGAAKPAAKTETAGGAAGAAVAKAAAAAGKALDAGKALADEGVADAKKAVEEAAKEATDDTPALSTEDMEKLLLALASCNLDDRGVDRECAAHKAWKDARNRNTKVKEFIGKAAELGRKHIGHADPAIRLMSANLMKSFFGSTKETQKVILDAAGAEKEPLVLKSMVRVVGSKAKDPAVLALLMKSIEHPSPKVRMEAVSWLTSTFADGTEGTLAKVMEKIEKDPDDQVRRYACKRLAGRQSEKALPLYEKLTRDSEKDPKLYAACFEGLVRMWTGFPNPSKPSQKAYALTLKRLKDKPRSDNRPPWAVMSVFRGIVVEPKNKFHEQWLEATKGWLKLDAVFAALADVAADPKTHWMARTGAIDTLKKLKAPQKVLDGIRAAYKSPKGKDKLVIQKLDQK